MVSFQAQVRNSLINELLDYREKKYNQLALEGFMQGRDEWDVYDTLVYETRFLTRRATTFKTVDMPYILQAKTYAFARRSMLKYYDENDMARYIKRNLNKFTALGNWQVIVGFNFALSCTAEEGRYLYFWIGALGFAVFKIGSYNLLKI
ncbi:hypothetical protein O3M35_011260 [Rhynocoris fuscipes]|uniref:Uncharacterized protein n=1 Tax=Rhynocoris fuscipes TaxID=488301 RepID=A0AAW1CV29_9HEMI